MEEVDSIIIRQLQEIGCSFEEEITSLKEMDTNSVFIAAIKCISLIENSDRLQEVKYTSSMNMGAKYKLANVLSQICQEIGYNGEVGYQTFLYGSDVELRKLFLFLIEKLPKDEIQVSSTADGQDPLLERIRKLPLNLVWLPPMHDNRHAKSYFSESQCLNNILNAKSIVGNKVAPNRRFYYDNYARVPLHDIASIIEWNSQQLHTDLTLSKARQTHFLQKLDEKLKENEEIITTPMVQETIDVESVKSEDEKLVSEPEQDIETQRESLIEEMQSKLTALNDRLIELNTENNRQKQQILKLKQEYEIENSKLLEFKASDKSIEELQCCVNTLKNDIEQLGEEWSLVSDRLIEKICAIKRENEIKSSKSDELKRELKELRKNINQKSREIEIKEQTIEELKEKLSTPLPPNRSSYTRRIMEIVNNVKKQNEETKKVLFETRQLQKEINTLSGKVQRSFTITDETIFKDAKSNDWNRKCYKLLATLHENYDQLLEGVNAIGTIKREILQLEEAVENEKNNKVVSNLTRIQADLNQMKLENQQIIMKYKALQEQQ